jgi:hypothetical protein
MAEGGTRSSRAISPALLWEWLRVYLLGSVWPILAANGVCAHKVDALTRAKAQSIRSGYTRRIIFVSSGRAHAKPPKNIFRGKERKAELRNCDPLYGGWFQKKAARLAALYVSWTGTPLQIRRCVSTQHRRHCRSLGFPGFPGGVGGAGGLHAAFFNESRTRGGVRCSEAGNPGSLGMTRLRVTDAL